MTLDSFESALADRIPTPVEFVAFARGMGWDFLIHDGKPALAAPKTDPLATTFARLLGREPYRTSVLAVLGIRPEPAAPAPDPEPVRSDRQRVLAEIQLRAGKRAIYGFTRDKGSCAQLTRDVPAEWDYVCVEGDAQWTYLPREEGEP